SRHAARGVEARHPHREAAPERELHVLPHDDRAAMALDRRPRLVARGRSGRDDVVREPRLPRLRAPRHEARQGAAARRSGARRRRRSAPMKWRLPSLESERLVRWACVLGLVALPLMVWSVITPTVWPVLVALSFGQAIGTASFVLYL